MRNFLVENPLRFFEPRTPTSEHQFEQQVLRVASHIMPNYSFAEWKPIIRDWHGHAAKPDIAMISSDLEEWYVVEVELSSHSIAGHIAPQFETLRNGVYDISLVPSLSDAFPSESVDALTRMVGRDPGLLCIVDQYTDRISRVCREAGFDLVVLEPYYGKLGGWAIFVSQLPRAFSSIATPTTFLLSRGSRLGNSIVMELPQNFPASLYKVRLPTRADKRLFQYVHVTRLARGPGIVLPLTVVPEYATARIEIVDPSQGIAEIVVEG